MTDHREGASAGRSFDLPAWLIIAQIVPAVAGIVIGTIALFAALKESDAVRKQQEASVWPHVQIDRSNFTVEGDRAVTITVRNRGIGPARIRNMDVTFDGEPVEWWTDLFRELRPDVQKVYPKTDSFIGRSVLSPEQDVAILILDTRIFDEYDLPVGEDLATRDEVGELINLVRSALEQDRLEMELCYCSVFDECWRVSQIQRDPWPVEACEAKVSNSRF